MLVTRNLQAEARRGLILLVVIAMLTLFAIVGIAFVYYAMAKADESRIAREAENQFKPDVTPEDALALVLGQLIYDVPDNVTGVYSALRGHSFSRTMYGLPPAGSTTICDKPFTGTGRLHNPVAAITSSGSPVDDFFLLNYTFFPYSSENIIRHPDYAGTPQTTTSSQALSPTSPVATNYVGQLNPPYTYPDLHNMALAMIRASDGKVLMPSFHRKWAFDMYTTSPPSWTNSSHPNWTSTVGKYLTLRPRPAEHSASFPFPEEDLGDVKNLIGAPGGNDSIWIDIGAPVMTAADGRKYKMLCAPLVIDLDGRVNWNVVGNMLGTSNTHISGQGWGLWEINPFKLDSTNVVSNVTNVNNPTITTSYNHGFTAGQVVTIWGVTGAVGVNGRWTVASVPSTTTFTITTGAPGAYVSPTPPTPPGTVTELYNAFLGSPSPTTAPLSGWSPTSALPGPYASRIYGRYGNYRIPIGNGLAGGTGARPWMGVDFDGTYDTALVTAPETVGAGTQRFLLPGETNTSYNYTNPPYCAFPFFNNGYANGIPTETNNNGASSGVPIHPCVFNPLRSWAASNTWPSPANPNIPTPSPAAFNRLFSPFHQAALLRWGGTACDTYTSDLMKLFPNSLFSSIPPSSANYAAYQKLRNWSTFVSCDLDRPGLTPYLWDPTGGATAMTLGMPKYTYSGAIPPTTPNFFPRAGLSPFPPISSLSGAVPTGWTSPWPSGVEFDANTRRSNLQQTLAALTPYAQAGKLDLNRKLTAYPPTQLDGSGQLQFNDLHYPQTTQAIQDRVNFAKDIYNLLVTVTGCPPVPMQTLPAAASALSADYLANRCLAQLAVNIVDFIDQDDYSTPWQWAPTINPSDYVYGVELPRLVLNEAYVQIDNALADLNAGMPPANNPYNINIWAELHNPLIDDSASSIYSNGYNRNDTKAYLLANPLDPATGLPAAAPTPVYQIVIAKGDNAGTTTLSGNMQNPSNANGDPTYNGNGPLVLKTAMSNADWNLPGNAMAPKVVNPANSIGSPPPIVAAPSYNFQDTAASNNGFYVVGPDAKTLYPAMGLDPTNPTLPVTLLSSNMTYTIAQNDLLFTGPNDGPPATTRPWPTILLQRLACPGLPLNTTVGSALYNPYITVDYIENNGNYTATGMMLANSNQYINDGRKYDTSMVALTPAAMTSRVAWGRPQPYAAAATTSGGSLIRQKMNPGNITGLPQGNANQPQNTFFAHNAVYTGTGMPLAAPVSGTTGQTLQFPFNWYPFPDRQLISPMELLSVPAVKPDQFTQAYAAYAPNPGPPPPDPFAQVVAPWLTDQDSRLYRFLEVVQTKNRYTGIAPGGRVPGKININGIWDKEVFRALCDAQLGNRYFYDATNPTTVVNDQWVDAVFSSLLMDRSPTTVTDAIGGQMPGQNDRPVWSLSLGHAANPAAASPYTDPLSPVGVTATSDPNRGLRNTILRSLGSTNASPDVTVPLLMDPFAVAGSPPTVNPAIHPYHRYELINKIYNNLTTRSNCFAVWLTVGYFEVVQDTDSSGNPIRPVKLGAEMNRADNRNIRHRMFAIIDRTNLTAFKAATSTSITPSITGGQPQPQSVTLNSYTDPRNGNSWTVSGSGPWTVKDNSRTGGTLNVGPGTVLVFDPDSDTEETVILNSSNQAAFTQAHSSGVVRCRGNPGPWPRYDPRKDAGVVPYWTIID